MSIFAKIFYSLLMFFFGASLLKYRKTVKEWTGNFYWAEKYLGRGGSYLVIIAAGLGCVYYGVYIWFK